MVCSSGKGFIASRGIGFLLLDTTAAQVVKCALLLALGLEVTHVGGCCSEGTVWAAVGLAPLLCQLQHGSRDGTLNSGSADPGVKVGYLDCLYALSAVWLI